MIVTWSLLLDSTPGRVDQDDWMARFNLLCLSMQQASLATGLSIQ